ncbi:hypothetical protein C7445_103184 [Alicyclobacillus sacchari]|uniref:Uncharacterized protein n=1 Tax=Alicyclobacillus sacchari TaxID=392010 RepID=A0A4R8LRC4_9BACL|nr:hypothetical protein C7445_103184 [Alicyclobacillus sacchari]
MAIPVLKPQMNELVWVRFHHYLKSKLACQKMQLKGQGHGAAVTTPYTFNAVSSTVQRLRRALGCLPRD